MGLYTLKKFLLLYLLLPFFGANFREIDRLHLNLPL